MEHPFSVVFHPGVVQHEDPRLEAIGHDVAGILQDTGLVLVVLEFNPGVVLGHLEEFAGRKALGREEALHTIVVGILQGLPHHGRLKGRLVVPDDNPVGRHQGRVRLLAPDIAPGAGHQKGRHLVAEIVVQVYLQRVFHGKVYPLRHFAGPHPFTALQADDHGGLGATGERKQQACACCCDQCRESHRPSVHSARFPKR